MDETAGLELIEELKNNPMKFKEDKKSYLLLQAYFKGLSTDTLRELFYFEEIYVRQTAIWIASELGRDAIALLKEVVMQMDDDDVTIRFWALKIVARFACGEYFDDFIKLFSLLEDSDQENRRTAMLMISFLSESRLHEAYVYMEDKNIFNDSHKNGLLSLIYTDKLTNPEIQQMIDSNDAIIRKYGIIAADKIYKKNPQLINDAVNSQDSDISYFSELIIRSSNFKLTKKESSLCNENSLS